MEDVSHEISDWVRRWSHLVPPGATLLDVACGRCRHLKWFAAAGARVTAVDRDAATVQPLQALAEVVVADIENGPWPFEGRRFDAVVVTHYLWRPLLPVIVASVADGGVLIYETFADGQQAYGRPSRAEFLLQPHELLDAVHGTLQVVAYEHGLAPQPDRVVQRLVARRGPAGPAPLRG